MEMLLAVCPLLLKCGVKGSLGLGPMEPDKANSILQLFNTSHDGNDKVPRETKALLKSRIMSSGQALFDVRAQLSLSNPLVSVGEHDDICLYYQKVGELDQAYGAISSVFEHSLSNLMASVSCETGFSKMNVTKNQLRNALSQKFVSSSIRVQEYVRDNTDSREPTVEYLKKVDQDATVRAHRLTRKYLRGEQRERAKAFAARRPRDIKEASNVMAASLGVDVGSDTSDSDHVGPAAAPAALVAPAVRMRRAKPAELVDYRTILHCDSYIEDQRVLAGYKVEGTIRFYAGKIYIRSGKTSLYTVVFRDGSVRNNVEPEELLDGWFRIGMEVFAPLEDSRPSHSDSSEDSESSEADYVAYHGKITETNYLDSEGMMKPELEDESVEPLVSIVFDRVGSEKVSKIESYRPIHDVYIVL